eukprot:3581692-Rhodomonas_salina.2
MKKRGSPQKMSWTASAMSHDGMWTSWPTVDLIKIITKTLTCGVSGANSSGMASTGRSGIK